MLNEDDGGSGIGSLLGQFGLGGGDEAGFNIEKMIELAQSRKIASMTLFEKIEIDNKEDFIANQIIDLYDFREDWEDSGLLKDFPGFQHAAVDSFSRAENAALKSVHRKLVKGGASLISLVSDEETGILTLTVISPNENLSLETAEIFYDKLEDYYVQKAVNKQTETYRVLKSRTDSLENAMNTAQRSLLRFEDRNRSLGLREYEATRYRLQGELTILQLAYGETYKNLQLAEFNLQNKTPMVSVIDSPVFPLEIVASNLVKSIITGLIVGVLIAVFFIIGRKIYRDIMAPE